ncbi:MAG: hypothetical protein WA765_07110 [Candidatus Acidiferrum sp.]
MSIALANGSTGRWLREDFFLVKLLAESFTESNAGVEVFGAIGIGEVECIATTLRSGRCIAARAGNLRLGNVRGSNSSAFN